jgi:hypothetical protein
MRALLTDDVFEELLLLARGGDVYVALVAAARALQRLFPSARARRLFDVLLVRVEAAEAAAVVEWQERLGVACVAMARAGSLRGLQRVDAVLLLRMDGGVVERAVAAAAGAAALDVLRWLCSPAILDRVGRMHIRMMAMRVAGDAARSGCTAVLDVLRELCERDAVLGAMSVLDSGTVPCVYRWLMACGACPLGYDSHCAAFAVRGGLLEPAELCEVLRWTGRADAGVDEAVKQGRPDVAERVMREVFDDEQLLVASDKPALAAAAVGLLLERNARLDEALVAAAREAGPAFEPLVARLRGAGARVTGDAVVAAAFSGSVALLDAMLGAVAGPLKRRALLTAMAACIRKHDGRCRSGAAYAYAYDGCYKALLVRARGQGVDIDDVDVAAELAGLTWIGPGTYINRCIYYAEGKGAYEPRLSD